MDEVGRWFYENRARETIRNLIKHGFNAIHTPDRSAACREILKVIPPTKTVGVGGSVTLRQMGIVARLEEQGNTLFNHWKEGLSKEESLRVRKAQASCDIFMTSANAITMSGEIVNVDGFGNRIASTVFGPGQVIVVAGKNKIVQNVPEAIARIKNIAAPMSAKRFGLSPPCTVLGRCTDCDSPDRVCRETLILERRPFATEVLIILVEEELGY